MESNYRSKYPRKLFIGILLFVILNFVEPKPAGKVVTVKKGDVRGRVSRSRGGRLFVEYHGIPYGKAERWELSRPSAQWDFILDATKKAEPCPFVDMLTRKVKGIEDCLTINVMTPQVHPKYYVKNMSVIVMIHGGFNEWEDHSGFYMGGKYFMDEDVVLVSFNYRLGPLGFLSTNDETIPANLGLKDQVLALRWVQKNIKFFGGNPDNVTLLGYGSGGASVHYHMLSPMSKGLFHRAIMQSGNALCPWSLVDEPDNTLEHFAKTADCSEETSSEEIILCLKQKNVSELTYAASQYSYIFNGALNETRNNIYFGPIVEHWMRNYPEQPIFIPHYPQNLLANFSNETMSAVPLLLGANELDGITYPWADHVSRQFEPFAETSVWEDFTEEMYGVYFGYNSRTNATEEKGKAVTEFYFKKLGGNDTETEKPEKTIDESGSTSAPSEDGTTQASTGTEEAEETEAPVVEESATTSTSRRRRRKKRQAEEGEETTSEPTEAATEVPSEDGSTSAPLEEDDSGSTLTPLEDGEAPGNETVPKKDSKSASKLIQKDKGVTFYKALCHRNFFQCTRNAAVANSKLADTYLYYFSYNKNISLLDLWIDKYSRYYNMLKENKTKMSGPVHGDEMQYLFDLDDFADFPLIRPTFREKSLQFSQNMVKMWINFARYGKPAADWEPLPKGQDKNSVKWYQLGDKKGPIDEPFRAEVNFWDGLGLDGLRDLPPLKDKGERKHRGGTEENDYGDPPWENSNDKYRDIIYIDGTGDEDGTGGLFIFPPLDEKDKGKGDGVKIADDVEIIGGGEETPAEPEEAEQPEPEIAEAEAAP